MTRSGLRQDSPKRRYLIRSLLFGALFYLLFITAALFIVRQQRILEQHNLAAYTQSYINSFLENLIASMLGLMPLNQVSCADATPDLQSRAAFNSAVRSFTLVRENIARCSSATGQMNLPVVQIYPELNQRLPLDIKAQQGTLWVPDRPAIAVWLAHPDRPGDGILATLDINLTPYLFIFSHTQHKQRPVGLALIAGQQALTTFSRFVLPLEELPAASLLEVKFTKYPITLRLYGQTITGSDLQLILLIGLLLAALVTALTYYILILRTSPKRAILYAIKRQEFFVEYQPVVEAGTQRISGFEALIRWQHPLEGRISPDLFIPYAEAQGLILPLTHHLFGLIARDAHRMQEVLPPGLRLGINISPSHLIDPAFADDVKALQRQMPADFFTLVFEITERGMVEDPDAVAKFSWIQSLGIDVAIDDFGTGHSALIYLQRFTLDYLKIDRGFVSSIGQETVTTPVLDSVLNLARNLNMQTVAEGVETQEQVDYLTERGANYLQGYLFSPPLGVDDLLQFYQQYMIRIGQTAQIPRPERI